MRFTSHLFHLLIAGALLLTSALSGYGQGNSSPTNAVPDRYLLVLDVSAPMQAKATAVQESVTSMLMSGMRGELKDGDEIGIWTFNNQLHTGEFDLQTWKASESNEIARRILDFIKSRHYENQTQFQDTREALMDLVANSRKITVILISDGDEIIQGTPFDLQIRRYFEDNAAKLKEGNVPVITVLRGYKGQLVSHGLSYAPWPVNLPAFPAEPEPETDSSMQKSPATNKTNDLSRTLVTTNKGPIIYAEPLIVSGKSEGKQAASSQPARTHAVAISTDPAKATNPPAPAVVTNKLQETAPAAVRVETNATAASSNSAPVATTPKTDELEEIAHEGFWTPVKLTAFGVLSLVVIAGLFLLRRKPDSGSQTSLITRSMDKRRPRRPKPRQ